MPWNSKASHPLILAMDECEQFIHLTSEFPLAVFETLRSLSQKGLSILTASKIPLREIRRRRALLSPAFNRYGRGLTGNPVSQWRCGRESGFVARAKTGRRKYGKQKGDPPCGGSPWIKLAED